MKAGQYSRGRGDVNGYAFKNRSEWIPFYESWLEDLRGGTATPERPVIEIQAAGDQGLACVYSRGFLVAKTAANYTHYLLFGKGERETMLKEGVWRMLAYDGYLSAEEFRAMDKPQGTPIEPMAELEVTMPSAEAALLRLEKAEGAASLLADLWKALFDRYERGGRECLIPVGCLIASDEEGEQIWTKAMALIRSVATYLPKPVMDMISVTVGADWSRYSAQSGSAWYICREENIEKGQREGLYDLIHGVFTRRCDAHEMALGQALLEKKPMRFYQHLMRTDAPEATGTTCMCYDMGFAANLYALERLLDDPNRSADAALGGALNAWRNLDGALAEYEKRGKLTAGQRAWALLPVMREITELLAESRLELTLNQCRLLIAVHLNPAMPDEGRAAQKEIAEILCQRKLLKNGQDSLLKVMTSEQDAQQRALWAAQEAYPALIGAWLRAQGTAAFLEENDQKALIALMKSDSLPTLEALRAQINDFCVKTLQYEKSAARFQQVLRLLTASGTPAAGESGERLLEELGATLCLLCLGKRPSRERYDLLSSYVRLEGTKLDTAWLLIRHLLLLWQTGVEREILCYSVHVLKDFKRTDDGEQAEIRRSLSAWLEKNIQAADYTEEEISAIADVIAPYSLENVFAGPVIAGTRACLKPQRTLYLKKLMTEWKVSWETLCPGGDFADYLLRVYQEHDIESSELREIVFLKQPTLKQALYAHSLSRLKTGTNWAQGDQALMLLAEQVTLEAGDAPVLFDFMKACQHQGDYADNARLDRIVSVLNRASLSGGTSWLELACDGLTVTGQLEAGLTQARRLCNKGLIADKDVQALTQRVMEVMPLQDDRAIPVRAFMNYLGDPTTAWDEALFKGAAQSLGRACAADPRGEARLFMQRFMFRSPDELENTLDERVKSAWASVRHEFLSAAFKQNVIDQLTEDNLYAQKAQGLWDERAAYSWMRNGLWETLGARLNKETLEALDQQVIRLMDAAIEKRDFAEAHDVFETVYEASTQTQPGAWLAQRLEERLSERFEERWLEALCQKLEEVAQAEQLNGLCEDVAKRHVSPDGTARKKLRDIRELTASLKNLTALKVEELHKFMGKIEALDREGSFHWGRVAVRLMKTEVNGREKAAQKNWAMRLIGQLDAEADHIHVNWEAYFESMLEECETERSWEEQKKDPGHEDSCLVALLVWQAGRIEAGRGCESLKRDFSAYLAGGTMKTAMGKIRSAQAPEGLNKSVYEMIFGGNY